MVQMSLAFLLLAPSLPQDAPRDANPVQDLPAGAVARLGTPGDSYESQISSLEYSRDGKTLFTGSFDCTVRIWDLADRKELRRFRHEERVLSAACSPDGRLLAVGTMDEKLRVWDVAQGRITHTLEGHRADICCLAFSPDGKLLASGSGDCTTHLWDLETGRATQVMPPRRPKGGTMSDGTYAVVFSRDGSLVISSNEGGRIRLWDPKTGGLVRELPWSDRNADDLKVSPDGLVLASAHGDGKIKFWELNTGRLLRTIPAEGESGSVGPVRSIAYSPDGRFLATSEAAHQVQVWEILTGGRVLTFSQLKKNPSCLAYAPDGGTLAVGIYDGTVLLLGLDPGKEGGAPESLEGLWKVLASRDASLAYRAARGLSRMGSPATRFLEEKMKADQVEALEIRNLVTQLDGDDPGARQAAVKKLARTGPDGLLRELLKEGLPPEAEGRVKDILQERRQPGSVDASELRGCRAVGVLEWNGSTEAVELLATLSMRAASATLSVEASAALARLKRPR